ncbi:hypothetical protein [Paenibacillus lupini]|uniref:hypothetical protein n=1 Tax=Paenibacillus lupini TaxID=1450204 RepID=UPI001421B50A|nr:hypothetical protein [Paenibacillus lupini]NIK25867.1 hypothetical protein [Paenibacillus lupini]
MFMHVNSHTLDCTLSNRMVHPSQVTIAALDSIQQISAQMAENAHDARNGLDGIQHNPQLAISKSILLDEIQRITRELVNQQTLLELS